MSRQVVIGRNTSISKLPVSTHAKLCQLLNNDGSWQTLIPFIRTRQDDSERFTADDVLQFERDSNPMKALMTAWSTDFVTVNQLIQVLQQAQLIREAQLIEDIITRASEPSSNLTPRTGSIEQQVTNESHIFTSPVQEGQSSEAVSSISEDQSGVDIQTGRQMAIKRLKRGAPSSERLFDNELLILSSLGSHDNLIGFHGISKDGPMHCIVCEYMSGGSLQQRLASNASKLKPITPSQRLLICRDTAQAIHFLHSNNIVHRDVKSANILLDSDLRAKLGDYGICRPGPSNDKDETKTEYIIGTTVYMAPEFIIEGLVSFEMDSFSFGMVLLEILTGLAPFDSRRKEKNLVTYIEENYSSSNTDIYAVIDPKVVEIWPKSSVDIVYAMATRLMNRSRSRRPRISDVLEEIQSWTT